MNRRNFIRHLGVTSVAILLLPSSVHETSIVPVSIKKPQFGVQYFYGSCTYVIQEPINTGFLIKRIPRNQLPIPRSESLPKVVRMVRKDYQARRI